MKTNTQEKIDKYVLQMIQVEEQGLDICHTH